MMGERLLPVGVHGHRAGRPPQGQRRCVHCAHFWMRCASAPICVTFQIPYCWDCSVVALPFTTFIA